jgi:hypothetical protein
MAFPAPDCGLDLLSGSSLREIGLHGHFQLVCNMYALPYWSPGAEGGQYPRSAVELQS